MNNILKKVEVKDTDIPFKIPYGIYILQYFLNILFTSIFLLFPLIVIIIAIYIMPNRLSKLIAVIGFTLSLVVYTIMYKYLIESTCEPKFKFYKKFKSYFLKKYILKKFKCLNCQNKIINYKPQIPNAQYYYNYSYFCSSCNTEFNLYKISEKGIRPILVIREQDKKRKN